jgi:hypothetical protein
VPPAEAHNQARCDGAGANTSRSVVLHCAVDDGEICVRAWAQHEMASHDVTRRTFVTTKTTTHNPGGITSRHMATDDVTSHGYR